MINIKREICAQAGICGRVVMGDLVAQVVRAPGWRSVVQIPAWAQIFLVRFIIYMFISV